MNTKRVSPIQLICQHCGRIFNPSTHHVHDQEYCNRDNCRKASGRAASKRCREKKKAEDPGWNAKEAARVRESRRKNSSRRRPVSLEVQLQSLLRLVVGLLSHMSGGDELGISPVEELFRSLQLSGGSLTEDSDFFQQNFGCT